MGKTRKLTITLPGELVSVADRLAKERKMSRSKLISICLQDLAEKQKAKEMAEGYINLAREQKKFADLASGIVSETLPEWE
jgi:metal-responsive CopG/Arc/MetJ family transcriptional regulator